MFSNEIKKEKITCDKIYITLNQLYFNENGMTVKTDNEFQKISNLHHDSTGYYYRSNAKNENKKAFWVCPECGVRNLNRDSVCWNCGYDKDDEDDEDDD
jgi:ABC-type ATPase with predicted acetyltransferase domain